MSSILILNIKKKQDFVWRNSPEIIIASTRTHLYNTFISDAIHPADTSTLVAIQMDNRGSMAFAAGIDDGDSVYNYPTNDEEKFRITKSVLYFYDKIPVNTFFRFIMAKLNKVRFQFELIWY
jgi:hypothetical protein